MGSRPVNQQGFGLLPLLLGLLALVVIGSAGWYVWDQREETTANTSTGSNSTEPGPLPDNTENPQSGTNTTVMTLDSVGLSMEVPTTWTELPFNQLAPETGYSQIGIALRSPDGLELSVVATNTPRGTSDGTPLTVVGSTELQSPTNKPVKLLTFANADGRVGTMVVMQSDASVGEQLVPFSSISTDTDLELAISATYRDSDGNDLAHESVEIFNQQAGVLEARQILSSLSFKLDALIKLGFYSSAKASVISW